VRILRRGVTNVTREMYQREGSLFSLKADTRGGKWTRAMKELFILNKRGSESDIVFLLKHSLMET
jgi:hypothetical protein